MKNFIFNHLIKALPLELVIQYLLKGVYEESSTEAQCLVDALIDYIDRHGSDRLKEWLYRFIPIMTTSEM